LKRNRHSPNEKAKIVLETFSGEKTLSEIAAENLQKRRILKAHEEEKNELYKQIGKLTTEVEWLKKKSAQFGL